MVRDMTLSWEWQSTVAMGKLMAGGGEKVEEVGETAL
jgi:hypothetical protein